MPRTSHDPASLVKRLTRALTPGLDKPLTPGLAEALAARAVFLVGHEALTESEVCASLLRPLHADQRLDAPRLSELVNDLASVAHLHLRFGREEVA